MKANPKYLGTLGNVNVPERLTGDGNAPGFDAEGWGLIAGADPVGEERFVRFLLAFALTRANFDFRRAICSSIALLSVRANRAKGIIPHTKVESCCLPHGS